jgi:hypothetical protein
MVIIIMQFETIYGLKLTLIFLYNKLSRISYESLMSKFGKEGSIVNIILELKIRMDNNQIDINKVTAT